VFQQASLASTRRSCQTLGASFGHVMDFLDFLLVPEVIIGTLVGLGAAALVHWWAPKPEPLLVEAALVAFGFLVGLALGFVDSTRRER
jgi:hypothetical protein